MRGACIKTYTQNRYDSFPRPSAHCAISLEKQKKKSKLEADDGPWTNEVLKSPYSVYPPSTIRERSILLQPNPPHNTFNGARTRYM